MTSVPMKSPETTLPVAVLLVIVIPLAVLPLMTLRAAAVVPPTRLFALVIEMPVLFGTAAVPAGFVPIRFPSMALLYSPPMTW